MFVELGEMKDEQSRKLTKGHHYFLNWFMLDFEAYKHHLKQLKIGKKLPDALYIEISHFKAVAPKPLLDLYWQIMERTGSDTPHNVIKLFKSHFKVSLLQI